MKVLNYIDSRTWAMLPSKLDELRANAIQNAVRIDEAIAFAESRNKLPELEQAKPNSLAKYSAQRLSGSNYSQSSGSVAVVNISDALYFSGGWIDDILALFFGGTSTKKLMSDIALIAKDDSIEKVALNINSPGGEAFGINEAANMIAELNKTKPVTAYISGLGCSAAYFLAANAGRIVVDKQAWVGSIGVVAGWVDYKDFYKALGIIYEEVTSDNAPYKRLDPRNEEHRQIFKDQINGIEKVFIDSVAKGRGVSVETVRSDFGKGSVMAGWQAVKANMADDTGNLEQVISELMKKPRNSNVSAKEKILPEAKTNKEKNMSFFEKLKALMASEEENPTADLEKTEGTESKEKTPAAKSPELIQAEARIAELEGKEKEAKVSTIQQKAETFATAEISAGRMLPTEKDEFVADYTQAAADDESSPLAESSRVERLEARQSGRKVNNLTREKVNASTNKIVLGQKSEDAELDAEVEAQVNDYDQQMGGSRKLEAVK